MNKKDIATLIFLILAALFFSIGWEFLASNSFGVIFLAIIASIYSLKAYYQQHVSYRTWFMGTVSYAALLWMMYDHVFFTVDTYAGEMSDTTKLVLKVVATDVPETCIAFVYWKSFRLTERIRRLWGRVSP